MSARPEEVPPERGESPAPPPAAPLLVMRVLLVYSNRSHDLTAAPPIGLSYVATAAADAGHGVVIVDLLTNGEGEAALRAALRRYRPDVVGLSVRNIDSACMQRPAWQIEEAARQIVIGGPAVSVLGASALERLAADYAVVGEGEVAFPALLSAIERQDAIAGLPGVYGRNGRGIAGRAPERLRDFGPSGMERWVDWSAYRRRGGTWAIQTKRGCPLRYVYCAYPGIEGSTIRRRTANEVADEIEHVAATIGPRTFEFVDSTFNVPTSHAMEICEELARRNLGVRLTTMGVNPIGVSKELSGAMRRAAREGLGDPQRLVLPARRAGRDAGDGRADDALRRGRSRAPVVPEHRDDRCPDPPRDRAGGDRDRGGKDRVGRRPRRADVLPLGRGR